MPTFFPRFAIRSAVLLLAACSTAFPCLAQETSPSVANMRAFHRVPGEPEPLPAQASTLPATQPTSLPAQNALPAPLAASPVAEPATKPHHAQVTYVNGLIDVSANDSSLNQILRSISRRTGMTITGGVQDQRVFGNYGPASPSEILATLLDGTGTNILLTEGNASTPPTLVLTPRGGGATPPSPNASTDGDEDDQVQRPVAYQQPQAPAQQPPPPMGFPGQAQAPSPQNSGAQNNIQQVAQPQALPEVSSPQPIAQPANNVLGSDQNVTPTASQIPTTNSVPLDAVPTPTTTTAGIGGQGIVDTPNPPAADSTTGSAPSTPQSIYQQLLKLQQQKQQQAPQSTPQSAPTTPQ